MVEFSYMLAAKPFSFEPMLCQSVESPPEGRDWHYELKLDGFRAIGRKSGRTCQLWSRNHKDFTRRFPGVASALLELPSDTVVDGEVVALDQEGRPAFNLLQGFGGKAADVVLYTFDLLMLRGKDVRLWRLEERRDRLREIVQQLPCTIRYSERFEVELAELIRVVGAHRIEGIVAKRVGSFYRSGERSADWLKWRANRGQEFVIGGYIRNGKLVDSILVGYYEDGDLIYAGRVRAGFTATSRRFLLGHFEELQITQCPFKNLPERSEGHWGEGITPAKMDMCRWLRPFVVTRIEFLEWTPESRLRHARFSGIRGDKDAREVTRDAVP
ncbi:MAG: non-homologous end-joining DNA ligase [Acidobacteriaceae bacterium]|nr:non-homologous end-joining DNA ligase [Acidobacteriaceae bacterium]